MQYAEAIQNNRSGLPSNIETLEDVIQDHKEFLIDLDSHKNIFLALNRVSSHLAEHVTNNEKAKTLQSKLKGLNERWDNICVQADQWQKKLQEALITVINLN